MFDDINKDIRFHYNKTIEHVPNGLGVKSEQWTRDHKVNLGKMMFDGPILDGIHNAQTTRVIYTSHIPGSVDSGICAEQLLDDLKDLGFDLDTSPDTFQEAEFTSPGQIIAINNRKVSVDFLYRLNICNRIGSFLEKDKLVVLEIGGGLGALARTIRLINPKVKYVIIDLLDTVVVSYGFLRANFPDATTTFVTDSNQLAELNIDSDFTFIPAQILPLKMNDQTSVNDIPRWDIDLVVNTQSLGEMRQDTTEGYMDLIENRLNVKRFYSLNHFLHQEALVAQWRSEGVSSTYCTALGPYWNVLRWEYSPAFVGHTRYGDQDHTLELYVEKIDPASKTDDDLRAESDELMREAEKLGNFKGHTWHRLMWESVRLCPRIDNVRPYYEFLKASDRRQYRYYGGLLGKMGLIVEEPYTVPERIPPLKRGLRRLMSEGLKLIARRIEPKTDGVPQHTITRL